MYAIQFTLATLVFVSATVIGADVCQNDGVKLGGEHSKCWCAPGFKGYNCSQKVTPCEAKPCRNGAECKELIDGTFQCLCTEFYTGFFCDKRILPCDSGPCQNGGRCINIGLTCFKCKCPFGYKGSDCSETVNPCEIKPCKNGGVCTTKNNETFSCTCKDGFNGVFCDRELVTQSEILNGRYKDLIQLDEWIGTSGSGKAWSLCYRATDNGWEAAKFHAGCDTKKPSVTIIRVPTRYIFGAYSGNASFGGILSYARSNDAFIFSFVNKDNLEAFKSPINKPQNALKTNSAYGPTFGAGPDIYIANNAQLNTNSYTNFGNSYTQPKGYIYTAQQTQNLLAGSYKFQPSEVEVFYKS